jgi:hypothetical protein
MQSVGKIRGFEDSKPSQERGKENLGQNVLRPQYYCKLKTQDFGNHKFLV